MLWETEAWNKQVVAPSPVCMPDGKIFITAGYGSGSMVLHLTPSGDKFDVEMLYEYKPSGGLACEQQTPLFWEGHLFGILPKDGGPLRNQLVCVNPSDTRKIVWASGSEKDSDWALTSWLTTKSICSTKREHSLSFSLPLRDIKNSTRQK